MKCYYEYYDPATKTNVTATGTVIWRLFYPKCPKVNSLCDPTAGAYVPAITVCLQHLWAVRPT